MKLKIVIISFLIVAANFAQDLNSMERNSMLAFNKISVTIGGEFITNGTFPASATEKVDEFVTRVYNKYRIALLANKSDIYALDVARTEKDKYGERGILLKHIDGTEEIIDLQNFRLTADFSQNPYLLNGDVLIFPKLDWERNFIEVEGAVNKPISFQFIPGDKLSDALLFARGINPAYENIISIDITRLSYDGMTEEIITTTVEENIELMRGDRVRFVADETQKRDFKVLIGGEVYKPGYIFITKNRTTLKEVIEKAGGFKPNADLINAELIRKNALTNNVSSTNAPFQDRRRAFNLRAFNQRVDMMMMNRMSDIELEDSVTLITDNMLRNARAGVTVDFREVLNDTSDNSTIIVKDGDIIFVPEITNLVYVFGQAMNPGFTEYVKGKDYQYYLDKTGGVGRTAKDEVYLIKGKTRAWIDMTDEDNKYTIESGDYIWVPKEIQRSFDFYLTRVARIAAIIGAAAAVILIFK